ncbi:uncharacterized protein LOC117175362 isoform X2 [Belonocnema kinseyi]|uniref:uncharacterized protein LOC117175362 isoform X2 n=1 Tax=Belonocnema kinseyi TaxID=2817044 RepID=UPI00143D30A2|nr:uncharacterized protein LOC117175362 isoform X2 [Belonocnema kinseyi]
MDKNFIFLCILINCLLGTVTSRSMPPVRQNTLERMNMKRSELKKMCDAKGEKLYENIRAKNIAFTLNLTERFMTWKKEASSTEDVYKLVQERCNKDSALKEMLRKFVESSQLCMDEKDHLKDDKLLALASRLMELFCAQYTHSNAYSSDEGCLNLVTNAAIDTCKEKYNTDQFIPLPFIYSIKECNDYQKYSECRLEAMKNCKDATKSAVEAADSITFHTFYGCHNISVIPEKITIKRSSSIRKEEVARFNITKGELQEKCLLNANMTLENIKKTHATNLIILMKENLGIFLKTRLMCITDSEQQESLIQDTCLSNVDLKNALEKIYETVDLCMDENDRFSEEKRVKVLRQSLDEICAAVKNGVRILSTDKECFQDLRILLKIAMCDTRSPSRNVLDILPLPFIYTPEDCRAIYETQNCQLKTLKDCGDSTKLAFQSRFNDARTFFGCGDIRYSNTAPVILN